MQVAKVIGQALEGWGEEAVLLEGSGARSCVETREAPAHLLRH